MYFKSFYTFNVKHRYSLIFWLIIVSAFSVSSVKGQNNLSEHHFTIDSNRAAGNYNPAAPWVLWYWMDASVSETGIRADLIAMKKQGIAGALLVCINGKPDSLLVDPPTLQLTPRWWKMLKSACSIADSLGLKLGMHVSDGFATSGGPWITPDLSMQRVVWSDTTIQGDNKVKELRLPALKNVQAGYAKDIAVYAFPALPGTDSSTDRIKPVVTTNAVGQEGGKLIDPTNTENFVSKKPCRIDYTFKEPFTCRSIEIKTKSITFQAKRLRVYISDDGKDYHYYTALVPARSGWQDYTFAVHYSIPVVTSRYFRFVYDPAGTEPGSEDLDDAKWSPSLKLTGLKLDAAPRIAHFEGKSGAVWRVARRVDSALIDHGDCIALDKLVNITSFLGPDATLHWKVPAGKWTILRMGHSSTGMTNATGGGGKGLECDKFNPVAVKLQYDHWFGAAVKQLGPVLSKSVLKIFYMDSWECGSQNWSPVFRKAFIKYRGYDPLKYLPAMAGYPVASAKLSEDFLHDVRLTIADLLNENYFGTLSDLAHKAGFKITAECTAPVMVGNGMRHFDKVDYPMGEFWLRSPTHDKPSDILEAISGGHIYGKKIIQAEAFTELRNKWDEYPGSLKTLQDHHYALGINRLVFHVFGENPWMNRAPGMTLNGVGLYFQRDQTWWPMVHGWMDYTRRCQALLQQGTPVTDLAVFNGEEIPSRAVLPDRLISTLPGLFGVQRLLEESTRLANKGNPLQHIPEKVSSSAGITTAKDWIDPLHGYKYDAINPDALLRLAFVRDGQVVLPGGASYGLLVLPRLDKMDPNNQYMGIAVAQKLLELTRAGATLLVDRYPKFIEGLGKNGRLADIDSLQQIIEALLGTEDFFKAHTGQGYIKNLGRGRVVYGPYGNVDLNLLGIQRDFSATTENNRPARGIAWNHRSNIQTAAFRPLHGQDNQYNQDVPDLDSLGVTDLYFVSNQLDTAQKIDVTLRLSNTQPLLYDPVQGRLKRVTGWRIGNDRTRLQVELPANGSVFILLRKAGEVTYGSNKIKGDNTTRQGVEVPKQVQTLNGPWKVQFDPRRGGPQAPVIFNSLTDWIDNQSDSIRHYSGTATYQMDFNWVGAKPVFNNKDNSIQLALGTVHDIASVRVNGVDCGVAWTYPYQVDITKALKKGANHLEIDVANTWANRIIFDQTLPPNQRQTWTKAPFNLQGHSALPAGLLGPVQLMITKPYFHKEVRRKSH